MNDKLHKAVGDYVNAYVHLHTYATRREFSAATVRLSKARDHMRAVYQSIEENSNEQFSPPIPKHDP